MTVLERLGELHPEGAAELARVNALAWRSSDPALLELCSRRIAALLGNAAAPEIDWTVDERKLAAVADWDTSPLFSDAERAHLAFCEQFVTSVSAVRDEDVAALREHCDDREIYAFVGALYVLEMSQRVDMVARATFAREESQT